MRRWLTAALILLSTHGSARAAEVERALSVGGVQRNFVLVTPDKQSAPAPLLIVFHGGRGTARQAMSYTGFGKLPAYENVAVVFPQGLDNNFNDGRVTTDIRQRSSSNVDDVAFTLAVVDTLVRERVALRERVFVTGASNGGMMSLRIGCEASDVIAGMAPVIANLPVDWDCRPSRAVPTIIFNGTDDGYMPIAGGRIAETKTRQDLGTVRSLDETIDILRTVNGCTGIAKTEIRDRSDRDTTKAVVTDHACAKAPLRQIVIEGGGHTWPGARSGIIADWLLGPTTTEIDASKEIWEFFKSLPDR